MAKTWLKTTYLSTNQCVKTFSVDPKYKLIANAYFLLSVMINNLGIKAYNSLHTRGLLIEKAKYDDVVLKFIHEYYYSGSDLCTDVLSASDFAYSAMGYKENGEHDNYENTFKTFESSYELIQSKPQYELITDTRTLLEISRKNQEHLYENVLKAYKEGKFSISHETFMESTEKGINFF